MTKDVSSDAVDTVLLDVDGTLIDSTYWHAYAWQRAFAGRDLTPPWWRIHRAVGMGGDLLVGELCGQQVEDQLGDQLRDEWADRYREVLDRVQPLPRVRELVAGLTDAGYTVALASSGAREFTDAALELIGMTRDDFAAVTSSDDAEQSKPAADLLHAALDAAGGSHAVLVGDSVWDVAAANRLPGPCVGVKSGGIAAAELLDAGAALVVDDVAALVERQWRP
ncbi:HAD family hydrolase [Gordonia sputi]|uniref:HAD family hydrolase n=1 Tax=Gordonia sputi TaxID=36823 RepID=UPI002042EEAF|nr:HAD family hydrolase [Gordonia sputi]MCM3896490.1 HAD family hydrolase [Gordonia sputi]